MPIDDRNPDPPTVNELLDHYFAGRAIDVSNFPWGQRHRLTGLALLQTTTRLAAGDDMEKRLPPFFLVDEPAHPLDT